MSSSVSLGIGNGIMMGDAIALCGNRIRRAGMPAHETDISSAITFA